MHIPAEYGHVKKDLAMQGGFGRKALDLLEMAGLPEDAEQRRAAAWRAIVDRFSIKSTLRKLEELHERGYIELANDRQKHMSRLTPRGRQTLESQPLQR